MKSSIHRTFADDDTAAVTVHGEIDFANATDLAQAIRDAVVDGSPATVRVDLHAATFIDSAGLGALIEGFRAATDAGVQFVVVNPSVPFRRVLTVTGLCDLFGLASEDPAIAETSQATGT